MTVLVARDVDAVDALAGVVHTLAQIAVVVPLPHAQVSRRRYGEAEALPPVVHPLPFVVSAVVGQTAAVTMSLCAAEVAGIDFSRIEPYARCQRVGLVVSHDDAASSVALYSRSLPTDAPPPSDVEQRQWRLWQSRQQRVAILCVVGHHFVAFVLHVVAVEVVLQFVAHMRAGTYCNSSYGEYDEYDFLHLGCKVTKKSRCSQELVQIFLLPQPLP